MPSFTVADTMDLWIDTARSDLELRSLLRRIDGLIINDRGSPSMLTGETNLDEAPASKVLGMGPEDGHRQEG